MHLYFSVFSVNVNFDILSGLYLEVVLDKFLYEIGLLGVKK